MSADKAMLTCAASIKFLDLIGDILGAALAKAEADAAEAAEEAGLLEVAHFLCKFGRKNVALRLNLRNYTFCTRAKLSAHKKRY